MSDLLTQLRHLAELEDNWDGYAAAPITLDAISRCKAMHFTPCVDGGIQIELTDGIHEVEITVDPEGHLSGVIYERTTRPTVEPEEDRHGE